MFVLYVCLPSRQHAKQGHKVVIGAAVSLPLILCITRKALPYCINEALKTQGKAEGLCDMESGGFRDRRLLRAAVSQVVVTLDASNSLTLD